jgi:hypothetical protein
MRLFPKNVDKTTLGMAIVVVLLIVVVAVKAGFDIRLKHSCIVEGVRYYSGKSVPCGEGNECNRCWCDKGGIATTLMFCSPLPEPSPAWLKQRLRSEAKIVPSP